MAKRELPPRYNRGKNPFYIKEIEKFDEQKTKEVSLRKKKQLLGQNLPTVQTKSLRKLQKSKGWLQTRRELYNENKKEFKFTRGIHYFYDLRGLERVSESVSYAIFPYKKQQKASKGSSYSVTYSRERQMIGPMSISQLINRNYIGLPQNQKSQQQQIQNDYIYNEKTLLEAIEMKRNDKNPCHNYLFEVEDKMHNADKMISQLQFLINKSDLYLNPQNTHKLKLFSIVEKDEFLAENLLLDNTITLQQKKITLQDKLLTLKAKRQKLHLLYTSVSDTYYHDSLDQRLYNQIKIHKQKLNRFSIYRDMEASIRQHQKPTFAEENSFHLQNCHLSLSSLSIQSEINDYYCIDSKIIDPFILANVFKLVSIRLFQQGENCFYFAKKIFLKLFNRQLQLQHQIKPLNFEQYSHKIHDIQQTLRKFYDRKSKLPPSPNPRNPSNSLPKNAKKTKCTKRLKMQTIKQSIKLKINQKFIPIDFYEFHCLKLFIALYDSLNVLKDFLQKKQNKRLNIIQQMGSLFYPKLQSKLVGTVREPQFGLLSEALDKLIDVILHPKKQFQPMNYELYVQFIEKDRQILTFLKQIESQPVSETSSVYKRTSSISQFDSENGQKIIEKGVFCHGRKMVK